MSEPSKWTTHHVCVDVENALRNWSDATMEEFAPWFTVNGKQLQTARDLRKLLMAELSLGHELMPLSNDCVGFDYKTGCPGHPVAAPDGRT